MCLGLHGVSSIQILRVKFCIGVRVPSFLCLLHAYFVHCDSISVIIFDDKQNLLSSFLCIFLHSLITSFIAVSHIPLFTFFSRTVNLFLFCFLWYDVVQSGRCVSTPLKNILTVFRVCLLTGREGVIAQTRKYKREICVSDSCIAEDWSQFYIIDWQVVTCINLNKRRETISNDIRFTGCNLGMYVYIAFKTFSYVVRHLDSNSSYLSTGLHLGFFCSWHSLFLPFSFPSVFLVLSFVVASTSMLFWAVFLLHSLNMAVPCELLLFDLFYNCFF